MATGPALPPKVRDEGKAAPVPISEAGEAKDEPAHNAPPAAVPLNEDSTYPTFDDDRPDSVFEDAADGLSPDPGAELLAYTRMDAEILGPSRVKRELMAFEQAVQKVDPGVREILENSLKAEFREVREFKP